MDCPHARPSYMQREGGRILEPRALLEDNLEIIKGVIRYFAYHYRLDDADDLEGDVMVKLVDNDYAVLRAFKGQSKLRTFLSVVVQRMALDRVAPRWRPSAEVQRLGPLASELDKLLHRDGRTLDEAVTLLRTKYEGVNRKSLEELAAKLPQLGPRPHSVPIDNVDPNDLPPPPNTDDRVVRDERRRKGRTLSRVVPAFIARLPEQDRLILRFRYEGEMPVVQIARMFALDQKATYRRIERIQRELMRELERAGITREDILDLIGHDEIFIRFDFGNQDWCQSMSNDDKTGPPAEEP
jgi:RNA polymerase sigma factor (sigma-70 family)